jgi:hypothetical protein
MITSDTRTLPDKEVVFTEMQNGDSVLLHLGTGQYFTLNQTGTLIWQSLEKGLSVDEISQVLVDGFDVEADKALQSVIDLVSELANESLVRETDSADNKASSDG